MRAYGYVLGVALLAASVGSAACDESLSTVAGPTPNLVATFSSIQAEIFSQADSSGRVACTQCHNAVVGRGGLDLSAAAAYGNLVGTPSRGKVGAVRVIPGDPENSYLIHKIEGRPGIVGLRMPIIGPPFLTDGQILVVKRWIELGARND
jgi:hypothetical protein